MERFIREEEKIRVNGGKMLMAGKRERKIARLRLENKEVKRRMERERGEGAAQSISPSIDQLMCCSEDVISPEIKEKTEGQKKETRKPVR